MNYLGIAGAIVLAIGLGLVVFEFYQQRKALTIAKKLLKDLVMGIHEWGSQEDGVPDEVYEPFIQAGVILGTLIDTSRVQEYGGGYIWKENSYEIVEPLKKNQAN